METVALERTLTELDHLRILNLVQRGRRSGDSTTTTQSAIDLLLDACATVPSRQAPPDLVTMYSLVLLKDLQTGLFSKLSPCYPVDAEPAAGFVSVLSPMGASLLGLRVGDVARWTTPTGDDRAAEVLELLFQPEASGDHAT